MRNKGFFGRLDDALSLYLDTSNLDYAENETRSLIRFLESRGYIETVAILKEALAHMVKEHHDPERPLKREKVREAKFLGGGVDETT